MSCGGIGLCVCVCVCVALLPVPPRLPPTSPHVNPFGCHSSVIVHDMALHLPQKLHQVCITTAVHGATCVVLLHRQTHFSLGVGSRNDPMNLGSIGRCKCHHEPRTCKRLYNEVLNSYNPVVFGVLRAQTPCYTRLWGLGLG